MPEQEPVVAAVATSPFGVLAGRRRSPTPPMWIFPVGTIAPRETVTRAAVREIREQTGLAATAGADEIGRRVHPLTHRTVIYVPCSVHRPATRPIVPARSEFTEVRWLSIAEATTFMPDMFDAVLAYLHDDRTWRDYRSAQRRT